MFDKPVHVALEGLEPLILWRVFDELRRIPRPSLQEEGVRRFIESVAAEKGWESKRDDAGNLVVYVPGAGAGANSAPLAIQGHMDMVCCKRPEIVHDFTRDPIQLDRRILRVEESERPALVARGTTLGSDNGLGLAAGLAIALDPELDHPPLQLVFTADEERGMSGAEGLDGSLITARRLLNLDAEEHGSVYLSCAGGRDLRAVWTVEREKPLNDEVPVIVTVAGLSGGHSGIDIHLGRKNAVLLLAQMLLDGRVELDGVRLGRIEGGAAPNAIPRRASATLWCASSRADGLCEQLMAVASSVFDDLVDADKQFRIEFELGEASTPDAAEFGPMAAEIGRSVLKALASLPNGVVAMTPSPDVPESSSNVGTVQTRPGAIEMVVMSRSSKSGVIESLQARMERSLEAAGATVVFENGYPGWEADPENSLVEQTLETYEALFGEPPEIKMIHGGLECGYIAERVPGVKMVAFGPEILRAHTPDEALMLDTVGPFWAFVTQLARDLC